VPFKVNQDRRHHIPRQRHKVTNWAEYDAALRQRGSLTLWFTEAAIAAWRAALVAEPAQLDSLPTDPNSGSAYVMWKGTPYAHVMVPVAPRPVAKQ